MAAKEQHEKAVDIRKIGAIIQKNWVVLVRDKTRLMPLILFPVFMILVFGYTTGNIPKHLPTALVDYDYTPTSQKLIRDISASDVLSIGYAVSTEGEARRLLDSTKVRGIIEIPQGFESDIQDGVQTHVTLIVDESDSAVMQTMQSTVGTIIREYSAQIGMQRLMGYQQSVFGQAGILGSYATSAVNQYPAITSKLGGAFALLTKAKRGMDQSADALSQSLTAPNIFIPPQGTGNSSSNDTIVLTPRGYTASQAQLSLLTSTSALIASAQALLANAQESSAQAGAVMANREEYRTVDQYVNQPLADIREFSGADPKGILDPVVLDNKPAYGTGKRSIDFLIASIIALTIFQGAIMGMGRAVAGEKREGSLTRVFLTPTSNTTIVLGTLLFYIFFEIFRSTFLIIVSMIFFKISIAGNILLIALIVVIYAGVSTAIGMIISSMVKTEQQYFAMSMLVSMPTIFLAGVFFPLQAMPKAMQILAEFLPVTYAGEALNGVMSKGVGIGNIAYPVIMLFVFLAVMIAILLAVFKRDIE